MGKLVTHYFKVCRRANSVCISNLWNRADLRWYSINFHTERAPRLEKKNLVIMCRV